MEPEGSLLFTQKPTSGPYLEPEESNSEHHGVSFTHTLILSSHLCSRIPNDVL